MTLKIYNTLTKEKEIFIPINNDEVKMYVCGVTVYDYCHLGHARSYIVFDVIKRYLKYLGYNVKHIQNFTDVDDKIINRANERNIPINKLTEEMINEYFNDMQYFNILKADYYPKVTEHINDIIEFIQVLINKGFAYKNKNNEIIFSVNKFPEYGKLSGRKLEEQKAGARIEISEAKENPLDFVLWKPSKEKEPGWESPWGKGRPGWHIECSVMAMKHLGEEIDIHCGGMDLIFPHHENEIAQSEAYSGKQFVKYWLHNGFVTINKEKMSKSLGNFFIIKDIIKKYSGPILRYFFLTSHYRSPIDYSLENIEYAKKGYEKIVNAFFNIKNYSSLSSKNDKVFLEEIQNEENNFFNYMNDDFNTAGAIGTIHNLISIFYNYSEKSEISNNVVNKFLDILKKLCNILGIEIIESSNKIEEELINLFIEIRNDLRKEKQFTLADKIRNKLLELGIEMRDRRDKTIWIKK
ncbi:MAG TPA: cysteine--tRNA ligase [bacterium]|nr:cysteine--tRNA ligase [bacterium]HOL46587.1 cysteine--tRNA ligase [bacterium]HPQ17842.1 cysteine--tRNA ligase [bacterium]